MSEDEWITLGEAVRLIGAASAHLDGRARLTLCEWLGDGLLIARVDRVIDHQLVETDPEAAEAPRDLGAILALGEPLPVWEWPTTPVIHGEQLLDAAFWTPVPTGIENHEFWSTSQMTCIDGNGTRARRIYVGLKVERSRLYDVARLFGHSIGDELAQSTAEPLPEGMMVPALSDRTGAPGAPSSMHIIAAMMRERISAGMNLPTMALEAEELIRLFGERPECAGLRAASGKTICNQLGPEFRRLRPLPK